MGAPDAPGRPPAHGGPPPLAEEVARELAARGTWRYSRASGPGGQRRDHAETRAELTLRRADVAGLPPALAARLSDRLGLERRPLRLTSQAERSRERNRALVMARLIRRVAACLEAEADPRRPTAPSPAARERRRAAKARRSRVKAERRDPGDEE
jgi:ribosome-associated protein